MADTGTVNFILPGLLGPLEEEHIRLIDTQPELFHEHNTGLLQLLRCAKFYQSPSIQHDSDLLAMFGINHTMPIAALTYLADFGELPTQLCYRCDPVHLQAGMVDAVLLSSAHFTLDMHEAEQLAAVFNAHFSPQGLQLVIGNTERWYLLMNKQYSLQTQTPEFISGKNITAYLPAGKDAAYWNAFLNEAQMLFFQQPLNDARIARGEFPINGIWIYGGDALTKTPKSPFQKIISDNALCIGLAAYAGVEMERPDIEQQAPTFTSTSNKSTLVYSNALQRALVKQDTAQWFTLVQWFEEKLFAPARQALLANQLALINIDAGGGHQYQCTASGWQHHWRRIRYYKRSFESFIQKTSNH